MKTANRVAGEVSLPGPHTTRRTGPSVAEAMEGTAVPGGSDGHDPTGGAGRSR